MRSKLTNEDGLGSGDGIYFFWRLEKIPHTWFWLYASRPSPNPRDIDLGFTGSKDRELVIRYLCVTGSASIAKVVACI